MIEDLLKNIRARAASLTGEHTFARKEGADVPITYYLNDLPAKNQESLCPMCLIFPRTGAARTKKHRRVELLFVLYQPDREQALADLDKLENALSMMAHPGKWSPWVQKDFTDFFGNEDNGMQPHPLYCYTISIDFESSQTLHYSPLRD